ncbi:HMG-Y-related protein B-like [Salvia miltiorrhiza]|uniref:HMG-Y-related protein B-like n=1 Tax=Salvia miltiorrhiza TaxID=226208 RepID=UPI0025AC66C2|nr:HMG-Y-related protein B-like [Salvia miltiorrhiza]
MASEELQEANLYNQPQPLPPAPAPTILPQYPEMILAAIEALGGSNKSSILRHIEAAYGTLPPAHSALLTHHLNKMRSSGQLHFIKNNYLIPDPNSPPRRGRGRPPKPKTPLPPGVVLLPPRPRGRPPKSRDTPPTTATTTTNLSGKKRGRPPKAVAVVGACVAPAVTRGRGRPPKVKPAATAPVGA